MCGLVYSTRAEVGVLFSWTRVCGDASSCGVQRRRRWRATRMWMWMKRRMMRRHSIRCMWSCSRWMWIRSRVVRMCWCLLRCLCCCGCRDGVVLSSLCGEMGVCFYLCVCLWSSTGIDSSSCRKESANFYVAWALQSASIVSSGEKR